MESSSFASSPIISQSDWSAVTSVLPSIFDPVIFPGELLHEYDVTDACLLYDLPQFLFADSRVPPVFIGAGASYRVYAQKFEFSDRVVAVKYIRSAASQRNVEDIPSLGLQRATVLRDIHTSCLFNGHASFISLLGWGSHLVNGEQTTFLATDFAPLGSLESFLQDHASKLHSDQMFGICADVAGGVYAMHSQRMSHGDIKTANILVFENHSDQKQYTAKLSDFGFSINLDFDDGDSYYKGTDLYNAPEVWCQDLKRIRELDVFACDVYSFGLLTWIVFNRGVSFLQDFITSDVYSDPQKVRNAVGAQQLLEHAVKFAKASEARSCVRILGQVLSGCLQVDPAIRLSMKEMCHELEPFALKQQTSGNKVYHQKSPKDCAGRLIAQPKRLDVFAFQDLRNSHSYKVKHQIAERLSKAAKNLKNPNAAELAFETSKCFAVGFGVTQDFTALMHWLELAAGRGHELAQILVENVKHTSLQPKQRPNNAPNLDLTTMRLEVEYNQLQAKYSNLNMDHIIDFSIYSRGDINEIEAFIEKKLSEAFSIDFITGESGDSTQGSHDEPKLPLMHWAIIVGHEDLVRILIKHGAKINGPDPFGRNHTLLTYALAAGQIGIAKLLLQAKVQVNRSAINFLFMVPPHQFRPITRLIKNAPRAQIHNAAPSKHAFHLGPLGAFEGSESPLSFAAKYNNVLAVEAFLGDFGDDYTSEQYYTACKHAAKNLQALLCDTILRSAFQKVSTTSSPLTSVFTGTIYEWLFFHGLDWSSALDSTIKVILSYGFDVNGYDKEGKTAMDQAVRFHAHEPAVTVTLLQHGAWVDLTGEQGSLTALGSAVQAVEESESVGCVSLLLDNNAPLGVYHRWEDFTALHLACERNAYGAAKALLQQDRVDVNASSKALGGSRTPLHYACTSNSVQIIQLLLQHNADITAIDHSNQTPLELAVDGLCIDVVEYFIDNGLPTENPHTTPPRSILAYWANHESPEKVKLSQVVLKYSLWQPPEYLSTVDAKNESPLVKAVQQKNARFVLDLLDAGTSIGDPHDRNGAWRCLTQDSPYQYYHNTGDSHQMREHRTLVQAFVDYFTKHNQVEACDDQGGTLLWGAAETMDASAVAFLLEAGASPHATNKRGSSPLHVAFCGILMERERWGDTKWLGEWAPSANRTLLDIVKLLLDAGADPNDCRHAGASPLHFAVMAAWRLEDVTGVELLCAHGADVNKQANMFGGATPLHVALEVPTIVAKWGICVDLRPSKDLTAAELEAQDKRQLNLMRTLLSQLQSAGVKYDLPTSVMRFDAPLNAMRRVNPIGLRAMLEEGLPLDAALATGDAAVFYTRVWIELVKQRRALHELQDPYPSLTTESFLQERRTEEGWKNLQVVIEHVCGTAATGNPHILKFLAEDEAGREQLYEMLSNRDFVSQPPPEESAAHGHVMALEDRHKGAQESQEMEARVCEDTNLNEHQETELPVHREVEAQGNGEEHREGRHQNRGEPEVRDHQQARARENSGAGRHRRKGLRGLTSLSKGGIAQSLKGAFLKK